MKVARMLCILVAPLALALASAAPAAADIPIAGQPWATPVLKSWLGTVPTADDAAGKVVIHWFCKPKSDPCRDDLARIFNMREQSNKIYVVAYVNGTIKDARKLDPVRGDVGGGAVAYGKPVAALMKSMGIGAAALPMAIVIGTDGKVVLVTTTGDPEQLDRRDAKIASLVAAIHEYTLGAFSPSGTVAIGQSFELGIRIELGSWLRFAADHPAVMTLTPPPDVTCDATRVGPEAMRIVGTALEASVRCKAAVRGSYQAKGLVRFNFVGPRGAVGLGDDGVVWKFEVRPDPVAKPAAPAGKPSAPVDAGPSTR